jgi:ubiquinone/menaquinone biosynthesis C-methylase UbiE
MYWGGFWDMKASEGGASGIGRAGSHPAETFDLLAHITRVLDLGPADGLIDVGCGNGTLGVHLSRVCGGYTGVDISVEQLSDFRAKHAPVYVNLIPADARQLPRAMTGLYQKALYGSTLQYMPSMEGVRQAVREAARVLCSGGRALFALNPDAQFRTRYIEGIPANRPSSVQAAAQALWFVRLDLMRLIAECGFRNVERCWLPESVFQAGYMFDIVATKG